MVESFCFLFFLFFCLVCPSCLLSLHSFVQPRIIEMLWFLFIIIPLNLIIHIMIFIKSLLLTDMQCRILFRFKYQIACSLKSSLKTHYIYYLCYLDHQALLFLLHLCLHSVQCFVWKQHLCNSLFLILLLSNQYSHFLILVFSFYFIKEGRTRKQLFIYCWGVEIIGS